MQENGKGKGCYDTRLYDTLSQGRAIEYINLRKLLKTYVFEKQMKQKSKDGKKKE